MPAAPPAVVTQPTEMTLAQRAALIQALLKLVAKLQDLILKMQARKVGRLGAASGRSCEGFIRLET